MEKVNIAEILKDCPIGMELDCAIFNDVTLYRIDTFSENEYPIRIETKKGNFLDLTKYGTYSNVEESKCVIFPKGKTSWKGFVPPYKFKVGDIIRDKDGYKVRITNVSIEDECYGYESLIVNGIGSITFNRQDDWELVPNKFDVTNFEPFMKVLVRSDNSDIWECDFFSLYNPECSNRFHCVGAWYDICIPYIGNEHLRGTTNDCDEYYKTWE